MIAVVIWAFLMMLVLIVAVVAYLAYFITSTPED